MTEWNCALELDTKRRIVAGSAVALRKAIRRGADLRISTEFRHNEHIDPTSTNPEIIREVADFRETVLLEDRWTAGFMTLRQPISLPDGFGPRPSMSLFMYNEDGEQAIARLYMDGPPAQGKPGPSDRKDFTDYPKYHQEDGWDYDTNAPSHNFIYDFEHFKYWVHDDWTELFSHDAYGNVRTGSLDALVSAFSSGSDIKVAISGLFNDLAVPGSKPVSNEVFIQVGPGYYYTEQRLFITGTQPLVRVRPAIPMKYQSKAWDYGWIMARTDGFCALLMVDPYTLQFHRSNKRYAIRWFVR